MERTGENGAERGADLHDGAFAPRRPTRPQGDRRGQALDPQHPAPDAPFPQGDCFHHFRHPVAPSLAGQVVSQQSHHQPAGSRHHHNPPARRVIQGIAGRERHPVEEGQVLDGKNQVAEPDGEESRRSPHQKGDQVQPNVFSPVDPELAQPGGPTARIRFHHHAVINLANKNSRAPTGADLGYHIAPKE